MQEKCVRVKVNRTAIEDVCQETCFASDQQSLFLAIATSLLEIVIRFESHPNPGYSSKILSTLHKYLEILKNSFPQMSESVEYIKNLIKTITSTSEFSVNQRITFLAYYLNQENTSEVFAFLIQHILILIFTEIQVKNSLISYQITKEIVETVFESVSEHFELFIILVFEDGNIKEIQNSTKKSPLAYFYITETAEIKILYTKKMIEVENDHLKLTDLQESLLRGPLNENSLSQSSNSPKISTTDQKFDSFDHLKLEINEKNTDLSLQSLSEQPKLNFPQPETSKINPEPTDFNLITAKFPKNSSSDLIPYSNSNKDVKYQLFNPSNTEQREKLPEQVVEFIDYFSQVIYREQVFDEKLRTLTQGLVKSFPELGNSLLICTISPSDHPKLFNPTPSSFSSLNPEEKSKKSYFPDKAPEKNSKIDEFSLNPSNPLSYPAAQDPNFNKNPVPTQKLQRTKFCSHHSAPESEDMFEIFCPTCSNTICNKCRALDSVFCIRCKRKYEESESSLLWAISNSLGKFEPERVFESEKKRLMSENIKGKGVIRCEFHGGDVDEDYIGRDFACGESCVLCYRCRIENPYQCPKCERFYSEYEMEFIEIIRVSMEKG